jgi:hypothetical protein
MTTSGKTETLDQATNWHTNREANQTALAADFRTTSAKKQKAKLKRDR